MKKIKNKIKLRSLLWEKNEERNFKIDLDTGIWNIYNGGELNGSEIVFNHLRINTNDEDNEEFKYEKSLIRRVKKILLKIQELGEKF